MNDQISGVYLYGGGPVRHYVFTGDQQRRRRTHIATLVLGAIFAVLLAYCVHLVYAEVSQPETATADVAVQTQGAPAYNDQDAPAAQAA